MNEETFKVRAYGYSELAQLYFPSVGFPKVRPLCS